MEASRAPRRRNIGAGSQVRLLVKGVVAMSEIKYEIIKQIGVLSTSASGWTKELNLMSWNDRAPKYDLRDWSADRKRRGNPAKESGGA